MNICEINDCIISDQTGQVQSCAVLVGGYGGCLVTAVLGVTAWLAPRAVSPLGPLWCPGVHSGSLLMQIVRT